MTGEHEGTPGAGGGPPADLVVRGCHACDADTLSVLCGEHARFERLPFEATGHALRLRGMLDGAPPVLHAWLALTGGQVVGYASASPAMSTIDALPYLHLDCLYVREGHRSRGIGCRLLERAVQLGRACGYQRMEWQTPSWNEAAARFYRRQGATQLAKLRFALALPMCAGRNAR